MECSDTKPAVSLDLLVPSLPAQQMMTFVVFVSEEEQCGIPSLVILLSFQLTGKKRNEDLGNI